MAKQSVRSRRAYAMALPDALMFYGIPGAPCGLCHLGRLGIGVADMQDSSGKKKQKGEERGEKHDRKRK